MRFSMSWRVVPFLSIAVGWGIAAGCSSFAENPTPEPLEAGTDAPAAVEAAVEAAVDAAVPRFCKTGDATAALFCADFDEGPLDAGWQAQLVDSGGLATTASDRSPPNALLSTIDMFPRLPDGGDGGDAADIGFYAFALLSTSVGRGFASGAVLEFDLRLDELPQTEDGGTSVGQLVSMGFDAQGKQSVALDFFQGSLYFRNNDPGIQDGTNSLSVLRPSAPGWFHVEMKTAFDGSGAVLSFNGVPVAAATRGISTDKPGLFLNVGLASAATSGKARVAYDNVTVTLL